MNNTIEEVTRNKLEKKLKKCTGEQIEVFMRMYSPDNLGEDIDIVVSSMDADKLDHALTQVENTIKLNKEEK